MSENKILNNATFWGTLLGLIWGTVVGVLLTIWGVHLQQDYEATKNDRELGIKICEIINARYFLAQNVLQSSQSNRFEERWDMYIEQGVVPWNIHRRMINKFIKEKHPNLIEAFENLDSNKIGFIDIHDKLLAVKNAQNSKEKNILQQKEQNARTAILSRQKDIDKINDETYNFK